MGANWGSRMEIQNQYRETGSTTLDAYRISVAKHNDNVLAWFIMTGEGVIAPITNIIQDCEASPPPSAAKIIGDVAQAVVFVAVIVSSAADFGESIPVLAAIIEAGDGADIAIWAALGIGESALENAGTKEATEAASSLFGQIKLTLSTAKVGDYADAIAVLGSVANLGATWAQMDPISSASDPVKGFAYAIFQGLSAFVTVYGSLEEQLALNVAVVATGPDAKKPSAYLTAIGTAAGASEKAFGRELGTQEKLALKASGTFINAAFIAGTGSTAPNDYIGAIINGFGGAAANFTLANVVAEFAQPSGTPDPVSVMTQR